jgi:6-phosphogluconate dehydrogenase (decarboxylating)
MDYLLRAATESALDDALLSAGVAQEVTDADGEVMVLPMAGVTLDRIGPIPARVDEENVIISPGDSRFHANLRVSIELTAAQVAWLPTFEPVPAVPYRVFI